MIKHMRRRRPTTPAQLAKRARKLYGAPVRPRAAARWAPPPRSGDRDPDLLRAVLGGRHRLPRDCALRPGGRGAARGRAAGRGPEPHHGHGPDARGRWRRHLPAAHQLLHEQASPTSGGSRLAKPAATPVLRRGRSTAACSSSASSPASPVPRGLRPPFGIGAFVGGARPPWPVRSSSPPTRRWGVPGSPSNLNLGDRAEAFEGGTTASQQEARVPPPPGGE
ncbi:hypothetical protein QJS66_17485 [Kocuria rhizophila]|nr:hypothetical protein QJS66_17485 [Kocuria rhizophila]